MKDIERGPVADRVSRNLTTLRAEKATTLAQLSERLGELGRPISISGLSKIERGERRVDVDDLVALAAALDVSPGRLLLPGERPQPLTGGDMTWDQVQRHGKVPLTPTLEVDWSSAWAWICGEHPLSGVDVSGQWRRENHPQGSPAMTPQAFDHIRAQVMEAGAALQEGVQALRDAGLDLGADRKGGRH